MDMKERFAQNLVEQRKKAGLTQGELAARADMTIGEVESAEAGDEFPDLKTLVKLAGSLQISIEDLAAGLY
jgi:transcriptional regulator with XRE-family HTH domain